jgi:hypothetical protein
VTVIACNLREIAADTLIEVDDARPYHTSKLFRLNDGSVVGYCGTGYEYVIEWLRAGAIPENRPEKKDGQDFQILHLTSSGILMYVNSPIPDPMRERFAAIGSGSNVAFYCMKVLKMTPAKAVRESIKVSPGCGGPIDVMRLRGR